MSDIEQKNDNELDLLRRLLLGKLYKVCENDPLGVDESRLRAHFEDIKKEHCINNCSFDEFVKVCRLKSHIPSCTNLKKDKNCLETAWNKKTDVPSVLTRNEYYNKKTIPKEEEDNEIVCETCKDHDDLEGNYPKQMRCGHNNHISCLIRSAQAMAKNNAECPICRTKFTLQEVPVPVRSEEQQVIDRRNQLEFNTRQMGINMDIYNDDEEEDFDHSAIDEDILEMIRDPTQHEELKEMLENLDPEQRDDFLESPYLTDEDKEVVRRIFNVLS